MKVGDLVNVKDRGVGAITEFSLIGKYKWATVWIVVEGRKIFTPIDLVEVINEGR